MLILKVSPATLNLQANSNLSANP